MNLFNYFFQFFIIPVLIYFIFKYLIFLEDPHYDEVFFSCFLLMSLLALFILILCFFRFLSIIMYSKYKKKKRILLVLLIRSKKLNFFEKTTILYFVLTFLIPVKVLITKTSLEPKTSIIILVLSFLIWIFSLQPLFFFFSLFYFSFIIEAFFFFLNYNKFNLFKQKINRLICLENNETLSKNFLKLFFGLDFKRKCLTTIFYLLVPITGFIMLNYFENIEIVYVEELLNIAKETTPELIFGMTEDKITNVHMTYENIQKLKKNIILTHTIILKNKLILKTFILSFFFNE